MQDNFSDEQWAVILNPCSGKRKNGAMVGWSKIAAQMDQENIKYKLYPTQYVAHATELAREIVENGGKKILVIGGDGTLNEVINGIFSANVENKSDITLALSPHGTGNDWARSWDLLKQRKNIVSIIKAGKTELVDIGSYSQVIDGKEVTKYYLNGSGMGLDADIAARTNRMKSTWGGHSWVYSLALVISLLKYRSQPLKVMVDGKTLHDGKIYTVAMANGCFCGGGIREVPQAKPNDGLLSVMLLKKITAFTLPKALYQLTQGKINKNKEALCFDAKEFDFEIGSDKMLFETDGVEIKLTKKIHFAVIEKGLKMIVP